MSENVAVIYLFLSVNLYRDLKLECVCFLSFYNIMFRVDQAEIFELEVNFLIVVA